MRYLTVMADYTGPALRDDFTGPVEPGDLGLDRELAEAIRGWNERYRVVIPLGGTTTGHRDAPQAQVRESTIRRFEGRGIGVGDGQPGGVAICSISPVIWRLPSGTRAGSSRPRVNVSGETWRRFRKLCLDDGEQVSVALGRLVDREAARWRPPARPNRPTPSPASGSASEGHGQAGGHIDEQGGGEFGTDPVRMTMFICDARYSGRMGDDVFRAVAGALILDARTQAGLTQAELAARAGTVQSAIAAYEAGTRQPTLPTLYRLLTAAGFDLRARLEPHDPHDDTVAEWEASLPATQRRRRRRQLDQSRRQARQWQAGLA